MDCLQSVCSDVFTASWTDCEQSILHLHFKVVGIIESIISNRRFRQLHAAGEFFDTVGVPFQSKAGTIRYGYRAIL